LRLNFLQSLRKLSFESGNHRQTADYAEKINQETRN